MQPQIPGQVTMRITCGGILGDLTRYIQADGQQVIVGAVAGSSRVFATDADALNWVIGRILWKQKPNTNHAA